jgi:hypothetical protein
VLELRQSLQAQVEAIRGIADARTALVVGRLIERQHERRREARKAWSKLA